MSTSINNLFEVNADAITDKDINEILSALPGDISISLEKASSLINGLPEVSDEWKNLKSWKVERLGIQRNGDEKSNEQEHARIIHMFAARGENFSIGLHGNQDGTSTYYVGTSDKEKTQPEGIFRSVFGIAEVKEYEETSFIRESWCVCNQVCFTEDELEKTEPKAKKSDWVDALVLAMAGMEYDVRIIFSPLDRKWIENSIAETVRILDDMTRYCETDLQISTSRNITKNEIADLKGKAVILIKGEEQEKASPSFSISESMKKEHTLVNLRCEQLKYHLKRLEQLKRDGGWCVSVRASAKKEAELSLVQAVLGSEFIKEGYQCRWIPYKEKSCMMLPSVRISDFAGCPGKSFLGFKREELKNYEMNIPETKGESIKLGNLVWNGRDMVRMFLRVSHDDLNRHAFICGMTGSGKSNTMCSLLSELKGIPFMVIEPVKGEYRALRNTLPNVEVYSMEVGSAEQLSMNPFWFPKNGKLQYHIDSLKAIISASFELSAAMPNILEQCLISAYVKKGWKIATSRNSFEGRIPEEMLYPTFSTLCEEVENYIEKSDFSGELKGNYKGALLSRLRSFTSGPKGMLLNCSTRPCFQEWIEKGISCVIELEALADDSDKAIVMGSILSQYFQCIKVSGKGDHQNLSHVIVLEEAHHLFKEGAQGSADGNKSRQHLVEFLNNLLAEIRAYGEGVFIVDQSPTGISSQVIKNTAVKIVHRTDYGDDLEVLQHTLLLDTEDMNAPASLEKGYALMRYGAMQKPVHVHMPLCEIKEDTGIHKSSIIDTEDVGNILSMLQLNEKYKEDFEKFGKRFINHLMFDDLIGTRYALENMIQYMTTALYRLGYDRETIASELTTESMIYALKNILESSLFKMYPDQYLLCGQILMAAERYLSLELYRPNGIKKKEWMLLREYFIQQIYSSVGDLNRQSSDRMVRWFALNTPHSYVAGILKDFSEQWKKQVENAENEEVESYSNQEKQELLSQVSFCMRPKDAIMDILWEGFQYYLDEFE